MSAYGGQRLRAAYFHTFVAVTLLLTLAPRQRRCCHARYAFRLPPMPSAAIMGVTRYVCAAAATVISATTAADVSAYAAARQFQRHALLLYA